MRALNPTPILLVLLALILLIVPASADYVNVFSNPSFESGIWPFAYGINGGSLSTSYVTDGSYSMRIATTGTLGAYRTTVDLTGVDMIYFDTRVRRTGGSTASAQCSVAVYPLSGGYVKFWAHPTTSTSFSVYTNASISVSDLSGIYIIEIGGGGATNINGESTGETYFDNFRAMKYVEPEPEYIYFDDSTYNFTDTVYVHYDRCYDPDEDGELDLGWRWGGLLESFLYAEDYLYVNVNAGEEYNGTWTTYRNVYGQKLNYLDTGNCWQSDHFLLGSDLPGWHLNATLEKRTDIYYGVYGVYGIYRGTYIEVLDSDLALVGGTKPDNITDGDPVIDVPIVPDYESNYTPPQPVEGSNDSLGTSFLGGYYQTVDSIIQPMNDTVSGAVSFVVSPVNTVSYSVIQVNGYATTTFDKVLFYVSPFGLFFSVIFDAIPNDTEIIIMFSLVCYLIAIVLRWK